MPYQKALRDLKAEREKVIQVIDSLEKLLSREALRSLLTASRRGRKPGKMSAEERAAVSARIKGYWAARRKAKAARQ